MGQVAFSPAAMRRARICGHTSLVSSAVGTNVGSGMGAAGASTALGARLRERRRALGLTQSDVADGRVSKEYVSQIELGKVVPPPGTVQWLADRVGVEPEFLRSGLSSRERARVLEATARAEALADTHAYRDALRVTDEVAEAARECDDPALRAGWASARAWPLIQLGRLEEAEELLEAGAAGDARVVFFRGVVAYKRSEVESAQSLLTEALLLASEGGVTDTLRSDAHGWRSRCHRRNGDWAAATEDAEAAIELAERAGDMRRLAYAMFQLSLVHERLGELAQARAAGARALELFEELEDELNTARMLNNLAAFEHLLGGSRDALTLLDRALQLALDNASAPDAGHVLCSLAEVQLALGDAALAEANARRALAFLDGRDDYLHEIGTAELTLANALLEQGRTDEADAAVARADAHFAAIHSVGHTASALVTRGDVELSRGAVPEAAGLYRQAAAALLPHPFDRVPD